MGSPDKSPPASAAGKDTTSSLLTRGIQLIDQKAFAEAIAVLSEALDRDPDSCEVLTNLGAALTMGGQVEEALQHFDRCLVLSPRHWPALANAASLRMSKGESSWAVKTISDAAPLQSLPDTVFLILARAQIGTESFSQAYRTLKTRRQQLNESPEFWLLFAVAQQYLNRNLEAEAAFRRLFSFAPPSVDQRARHGQLLADLSDIGSARALSQRALVPADLSIEALICYGRVMEVLRQQSESTRSYRYVIEHAPNRADAWINLGNLEKRAGKFAEAESYYRKAISMTPRSPVAHKNLADLLGRSLRTDEAIAELETSVSLQKLNPYFHSDLLFAEHYTSALTAADLAARARMWGRRHVRTTPDVIPLRDVTCDGRLRVGLLSGSFRRHPVGFLGLPGLEKLNRDRFAIHCFANQVDEDRFTKRFRHLSDRWHAVAHLNDAQLHRLMRDSNIDILIEMSGHASGHRLPVVARRVAPVQIKWVGGQFDTMGVDAIDYFLSDRIESPPEHDSIYSESIHRLPLVYACYQAPEGIPDVSGLPALNNGHVTFGSLNKTNKISAETVALWSRCLNEIPNSRFILQAEPFADKSVVDRLHAQFSSHGVAPERIECREFQPHPQLFETYHDIDVALDTTPYSGCLTTCEAMWMGVPVVTLPGPTFAGRHSASFLSAVGLSDWVTTDENNYVAQVQEKITDLRSLAELRSGLRQRMKKSPLCDSVKFGLDLGSALEEMWTAIGNQEMRSNVNSP